MTIIQRLDTILNDMGIVFYPGYHEGDGDDYGVYEGMTDSPDIFADNQSQVTICACNVHLFVKEEKVRKKRKLLRLLRSADICVGDIYEQYEAETGYTHYIVELEMLGENEMEE